VLLLLLLTWLHKLRVLRLLRLVVPPALLLQLATVTATNATVLTTVVLGATSAEPTSTATVSGTAATTVPASATTPGTSATDTITTPITLTTATAALGLTRPPTGPPQRPLQWLSKAPGSPFENLDYNMAQDFHKALLGSTSRRQ
jgi:hypothetical protein